MRRWRDGQWEGIIFRAMDLVQLDEMRSKDLL